MADRRMISDTGYEVLRSQWVGGTEYLMAENQAACEDERYMVCDYTRSAILGQYSEAVVGGEMDEATQEFKQRVNTAREAIKNELDRRGLPAELFNAEDCIPHSYEQDINGKVVVIKSEALSPEYRRGSEQLMYVLGGFGANANSRGNAVFCCQLSDGEKARYERYQVLGIVKELPDWAQERLTAVKEQLNEHRTKSHKERNGGR